MTPGGRVTTQDNRVDCGNRCRTTYLEGRQGVFWADPDPNFYLVRWDGACTGTLPYCIVTAQPGTRTVTVQAEFAEVGTGRVAIIAYSPVTFPVGGTICGQTCRAYLLGTYVSVLPDPPPGYRFVQWTQGPCWGSYTHKCSFQATQPVRLSYDVLPDR